MSAVLLTSIGILLIATVASLTLWIRSGERRVALLSALLMLLAVRQGVAFWLGTDAPLVLDPAGAAELAALAASVLGLAAVGAMARTVAERDGAEALHWDSMEVVRVLGELARKPTSDLDDNLSTLLRLGCARFALPVGVVSRLNGQRCEVVALEVPPDLPVETGASFELANTPFGATVSSDRPLALERVEDAPGSVQAAFCFRSYLGTAIRVGGAVHGTLSFGGIEARKARFTGTDKDLLNLMAQWIGAQIERREALYASDDSSAASEALPTVPGAGQRVGPTGGVDLNAIARRVERRLRSRLGQRVEIDLTLAPERQLARANRGVVEAVVQALVLHARDAMPEGGRITVETRRLESGGGDPAAAGGYVTLSVSDTGSQLDADALSRVFEPSREPIETDLEREPEGRLALSTAYQLIQHDGGDISVDVRSGRGATFTVYLPRAEQPPVGRRKAAASAAESQPDTPSEQPARPHPAIDPATPSHAERKGNGGLGVDAGNFPAVGDS